MLLKTPWAPGLSVRDLKRPEVVYRQLTWRKRALPDFVIIGAQKSGTTSLHHYLIQHPQIVKPNKKEVHYFDGGLKDEDNFAKGEAWYRSHFPYSESLRENQQTFEASPLYLFHPCVAERMQALMPSIKLIALLRNPIERAISHFYHTKRKGKESRNIMQAFSEEQEAIEQIVNNADFQNPLFYQHSYLSRGMYSQQLQRFLKYYSREQLLILQSESLFQEPEETLEKIYTFLNIDRYFSIKDLAIKNMGSDKDKVSDKAYSFLQEYFKEPNQELFELLGERFDW